jgi:hypothetical protein
MSKLDDKLEEVLRLTEKAETEWDGGYALQVCERVPRLVKALLWLRQEHWKQIDGLTEHSGIADADQASLDIFICRILEGTDADN